MTPAVWILLLAACGALGWIVALVLGFRVAFLVARVVELQRDLGWWQRKALDG